MQNAKWSSQISPILNATAFMASLAKFAFKKLLFIDMSEIAKMYPYSCDFWACSKIFWIFDMSEIATCTLFASAQSKPAISEHAQELHAVDSFEIEEFLMCSEI